jgi:HD superfamily phosphohydrolase YqeK
MEFTSDEIIDAVNNTSANFQAKDKLKQMLFLADMVKFAKMKPTALEHDQSLNHATDFVRETIHIVENSGSELTPETNNLNKILEEGKKE